MRMGAEGLPIIIPSGIVPFPAIEGEADKLSGSNSDYALDTQALLRSQDYVALAVTPLTEC